MTEGSPRHVWAVNYVHLGPVYYQKRKNIDISTLPLSEHHPIYLYPAFYITHYGAEHGKPL